MIYEMQESILTKLKADLTDLGVEPYPDDPKKYRLKHKYGVALLRYIGSSFKAHPQELGRDAAVEFLNTPEAMRISWEVRLKARSLKGTGGAGGVYQNLDAIRASLTGFIPTGAAELLPTKEGFASQEDGLWEYFIHFQTTT